LNSDKIWTIWKKGKLKCEKIWKIWKKAKLNSEKIRTMRRKSRLNCEMIWPRTFSNRDVWNTTFEISVSCFSSTWRYKTFHFPVLFSYLFTIQLTFLLYFPNLFTIQRHGNYGRRVSWIVKRFGKYRRK
jgi:hypothetical protein